MSHFPDVLKHIEDCINPHSDYNRGQHADKVFVNRRHLINFHRDWERCDQMARKAYAQNEIDRQRIKELEKPIQMILFCPACGLQHIDQAEVPTDGFLYIEDKDGIRHAVTPEPQVTPVWTNPPHRSHLCHGCGHIWRPADVATEGVASLKTIGKVDTYPALRVQLARSVESKDVLQIARYYGKDEE